MITTKLIDVDDIRAIRPITVNIDAAKRIDVYILEAQNTQLKDILGKRLYYDLVANYTNTEYSILLTGGSYVVDGETYYFAGVKTILAYLAYARFVREDGYHSTNIGMVVKSSSDSLPVENKDRSAIVKQIMGTVESYIAEVVHFLDNKTTTYPLWECPSSNKNAMRPRIIKSEVKDEWGGDYQDINTVTNIYNQ